MGREQLANKKKQKRAEKKRQKFLKNREVFDNERKQKNIEHKVNDLLKAPCKPIVNPGTVVFDRSLSSDEIMSRIEHNLEVLKALEEDYDRESAEKLKRNQELEEQGFLTLQQKMDALNQQVLMKNNSVGGEAEVAFVPNL